MLKERFARINEKTVKITSESSILIRHTIDLIDDFGFRCLINVLDFFSIFFSI